MCKRRTRVFFKHFTIVAYRVTGFAVRLLCIAAHRIINEWRPNRHVSGNFTVFRRQLKKAISNKTRLHVVIRFEEPLIKRVTFTLKKVCFVLTSLYLFFVLIKRVFKRPPGILTIRVHGGNSRSAFSSRSMRFSGPGACSVYTSAIRISQQKKMKFSVLSARVPYMQMYVQGIYMHDESDYIGRVTGT